MITTSIWIFGCMENRNGDEPITTVLQGKALGTTWTVKILSKNEIKKEELRDDIGRKLEEGDKIFSHWRKDSNLYQFNAALTTTPLSVLPPLLDLLEHAEWINRQSEGAFDPTLAPVINLWGFGPVGETRSTIPTGKQILEAKKLTGMDKFKVLPKGFIQKTLPGLQLDFSGSAKGEIIDQVCTLLQRWNFNNFLVELGGEVRAHGKGRNGKGWIIGLEDGSGDSESMVAVPLRNYSVATSGTYQLNKPNPDANRSASHLLDPRTGRPIEHELIAVNAFAPTARDAEKFAFTPLVKSHKTSKKNNGKRSIIPSLPIDECFFGLLVQQLFLLPTRGGFHNTLGHRHTGHGCSGYPFDFFLS